MVYNSKTGIIIDKINKLKSLLIMTVSDEDQLSLEINELSRLEQKLNDIVKE